MNLIQRNEQLIAQLHELERTKSLASQASHFEKRAQELGAAAQELVPISKIVVLLSEVTGIQFKSLSKCNLEDWDFRFTDLQKKYAANPETILDPTPGEDPRTVLLNPLRQLTSKIRTSLGEEWSTWSLQEIPAFNDELMNVLSTVASMKSKVEQLRSLKRSINETANNLPDTRLQIDSFLISIKSIRETLETLEGEGVPKEVVEFLRAAGRPNGASLAQLTPVIHKWFADQNLVQSLRVRVI
jgi:DNA repair ATPase RecN